MAEEFPSYDSIAKRVIQLQPAEMISWITGLPLQDFRFEKWIDPNFHERQQVEHKKSSRKKSSRKKEGSLRSDLLAEITRLDMEGPPWAWGFEVQAMAEYRMDLRLDGYRVRSESDLRFSTNPKDRYIGASALINLQGTNVPPTDVKWGTVYSRTVKYPIVNLEERDADTILQEIRVGTTPFAVLGWIPLMKNGNTPSIIQGWLELANNIPDDDPDFKDTLKSAVISFSELVKQGEAWADALKGWNVVEVQFIKKAMEAVIEERVEERVEEGIEKRTKEIQKVSRQEGLEAGLELGLKTGRQEGRQEALIEERQDDIIGLGRRFFGDSPTHVEAIEAIKDYDRLKRMKDAFFDVKSWNELLAIV